MSKNTTRTNNGHDLQAINWVRDSVRGLSIYERALLQYLATRCKSDGDHSCHPDQQTIANDLEMNRRTVMRYLKSLNQKGLITTQRRPNTSSLYTLHVPRMCSEATLPDVQWGDTSGSDSQMHHKERKRSKESEARNQKETGTTSPAGTSALEKTKIQQGHRDQGLRLVEGYRNQCKDNEKARIGFYMKLGRLHTKHPRFHKPKNPQVPLKRAEIDSLNEWFRLLPESGCDVMNFAMQNWTQIYADIPAWRNFRNVNPLISALGKYGHKELFDLWKQSQYDAMLRRVENLQTFANGAAA